MRAVCIIPARGGSKRIPRKNIRNFLGAPILHYSIRAAIESGVFSNVVLSTDDEEIANSGMVVGASVPFMRSQRNSDDHSTTADVIKEVLDRLKDEGSLFDVFCCVYPTAPFVTAEKLRSAFELLADGTNAVVPIVRFGFPVQRAFRMEGGFVKMVHPEHLTTRSQDLEPRFHDAGQFYFGRVPVFQREHSMFPVGTSGMEVSELEVQDIDNEVDWRLAELKYQLWTNRRT